MIGKNAKYAALVTALMVAATAHAGGKDKPDPKDAAPVAHAAAAATASAEAVALAAQQQGQVQGQYQAAHGGDGGHAKATGGEASANNEGIDQDVQLTYPRQAPAIAQGSIAIAGCGAGGNAGGSGTGGAGFLGFSWVTKECHGWTLAQTYAALGYITAACEVANSQKAAQRAKARGATLPDCNNLPVPVAPAEPAPAPSPAVVVVQSPDLSQYVTKEALDRATRQVLSK